MAGGRGGEAGGGVISTDGAARRAANSHFAEFRRMSPPAF